jgi:hypothetical protein
MHPATGRRAILVHLLLTWIVGSLFYLLIIKRIG